MPTHHGSRAFHRGMHAPHSTFFASGKFGRLFPTLPALFHRDKTGAELREALVRLGARGGPMDPATGASNPDNAGVPAGFAFLGQFIDHDVTLDTTSSFERQNDPEGIANFRTPALELDSVYGSGPAVTPHLYQPRSAKLLLDYEHKRDQIARNSANTALIGDPRNDENLVIQQLQLAFIRFHNAVVDAIEPDVRREHLFEEAQRITRWHYQWIVLHEYLPLTVGQDLVDEVYDVCAPRAGRRYFNWRNTPFIPVEFSVAAYRFGHSQIPSALRLNDDLQRRRPRPPVRPRRAGRRRPRRLLRVRAPRPAPLRRLEAPVQDGPGKAARDQADQPRARRAPVRPPVRGARPARVARRPQPGAGRRLRAPVGAGRRVRHVPRPRSRRPTSRTWRPTGSTRPPRSGTTS